jgi:hypothetical protein
MMSLAKSFSTDEHEKKKIHNLVLLANYLYDEFFRNKTIAFENCRHKRIDGKLS